MRSIEPCDGARHSDVVGYAAESGAAYAATKTLSRHESYMPPLLVGLERQIADALAERSVS